MKHGYYIAVIAVLLVIIVYMTATMESKRTDNDSGRMASTGTSFENNKTWMAPDTSSIPEGAAGDLIRYGRALIVHTAQFFGPRGGISRAENGLNCQNCHLAAGTRIFANNFSKTIGIYPKYRARRSSTVSLEDRVNGCMERSMNGKPLPAESREMKAFIAYFNWVGEKVDKKEIFYGESTEKLPFLDRPADPIDGRQVFMTNCASCHGKDGRGLMMQDSIEYLYPPLWGPHSYNMGAGMFRIGHFASFVKNNMPFGTTHHSPVLSTEEAWDVAAFVNSQPHPPFDGASLDWQDISDKPFDYPFGPFADSFSEKRHKYGPFEALGK